MTTLVKFWSVASPSSGATSGVCFSTFMTDDAKSWERLIPAMGIPPIE